MRMDKVNAKKGHIQIHQDLVIKNDVREVTRFGYSSITDMQECCAL